jgi:CRISPR-associated protein Cmr1
MEQETSHTVWPGETPVSESTISLKTLTPLWTGGVDQNCDRLHETGLIGSLRWWCEALVRGLGGYACDPTGEAHCPDKDGKRCVACELFGCTGWSRKFRLVVKDSQGQLIQNPLERNTSFQLEFVNLRPTTTKEIWLLTKAVEIAVNYGSVGGKTTLKPQSNVRRPQDLLQSLPHVKPGDDMGVLTWQKGPSLDVKASDVKEYLAKARCSKNSDGLPNLRWFFFVNGSFLKRDQMNDLMGRSADGKTIIRRGPVEDALRGEVGISKKLFSSQTSPGRIWGYAPDVKLRDAIIERLRKHPAVKTKIMSGEEVIGEL